VPVWHEKTKTWVREGKLALLGMAQEQHPDRCRLLAQWKRFDWPILQDRINIMTCDAVPILIAIDEHGIVRNIDPQLETFERTFVEHTFPDNGGLNVPAPLTPRWPRGQLRPDFVALRQKAMQEARSSAWRELGDALALWGGEERVSAAIDAYARAAELDATDAAAVFRLGVCYRRRYDSSQRQLGDFQKAIDYWGRAVEQNPNQYIWRRRIEQYGPPLDKPYAFYDWIKEAEQQIVARGDQPAVLLVRPSGAEIAHPAKELASTPSDVRSPDGGGKVLRDRDGLVRAEVTIVPSRVQPGHVVRIHVVLRLDGKRHVHWNNEAGPMRLWMDLPPGWQSGGQLLVWPREDKSVTDQDRSLDFDVKAPAQAEGKIQLNMYALYYVCDDAGGRCRFLRLDIPAELHTIKR
jgi:tetratricopeptide (TPR) repeat protein